MKAYFLSCISFMLMINVSTGFSIQRNRITSVSSLSKENIKSSNKQSSKLFASETENAAPSTDETDSSTSEVAKKSLEDKMKEWEASEEEMKAASLGGITPGRADGFDIGLFLAFPFIVGSALFFAVFPFIMDKIDVSSVGPPPTV